jgi:peptidoglycan/xylan/chitin deacetylase (PgdA/CDA1 family)
MDNALNLLIDILRKFECGATLPVTASVLARHGQIIEKYQADNIEFAMHGLFHVDYSQLSLAEQKEHVQRAREIFQGANVNLVGFRCPYLRWNDDTLAAVANNGLRYDSSQALHWDVVDGCLTEDYQHVLGFYGSIPAADYPALPRLVNGVVQIPYCLPDDEAIIERLRLGDAREMSQVWLGILERTHELGELFTLGLHPERIGLLDSLLATVLAEARRLSPRVWITRLDELTGWWQGRSQARFDVSPESDGWVRLHIQGPPGVTVLARRLEVEAPLEPWCGDFYRVPVTGFRFRSKVRPWVGLSPDSSPALASFLRQQGYWVESSNEDQAYSIYLSQAQFTAEDERSLLRQLADSQSPLLRLGRWPDGAYSALCITGDIDALTLWDYGLRSLGR